jgi:hypothetical protein
MKNENIKFFNRYRYHRKLFESIYKKFNYFLNPKIRTNIGLDPGYSSRVKKAPYPESGSETLPSCINRVMIRFPLTVHHSLTFSIPAGRVTSST